MGLLQKIKSALGFDGTQSTTSSGTDGHTDVDVTVEREPATESEDAVKGTETSATGVEPDHGDADETDEELTDDQVDETDEVHIEEAEDEAETDAGHDEEAEADHDEMADAEDEGEEESEVEAEDAADAEPDDDAEAAEPAVDFEGADDPVTEIKGIGPAYAERLSGLGIETVGDLSVADAAEIAAQTDLAESRVAGWIESANDY